jgi:hypothetical protein
MDLRPGYREVAPPPALAGTLACLWVRVVPAGGAVAARVLPDACADLIWQAGRGAFVAGPDTGPNLAPLPPGAEPRHGLIRNLVDLRPRAARSWAPVRVTVFPVPRTLTVATR